MQKAKLRFTNIDHIYNEKYGKYPDYDYIRMYHENGAEYANKTIQNRINGIWQEMKQSHERQQNKYLESCPFE